MKTALFNLFVILLLANVSIVWASGIPRTIDGYPNFEGVWYFGSATPLERPIELGTRKTYSDAEAKSIIAKIQQDEINRSRPSDPARAAPEVVVEVGQEADDNFVSLRTNLTRINGAYRTSLVTKPENGRLPFRDDAQDIFDEWQQKGIGQYDGPETRPASERCLSVVGPIAPTIGWYFNANMRIVQTSEHIVIQGEMLKPRIIPLGRRKKSGNFPLWMGRAAAHWEGDTLVISSSSYREENSWFLFKSSDQLEITEYFNLINRDELLYRYVVVDRKIYSEPFVVEMSITRRTPGEVLYEFACHEANYSLPAILRGARLNDIQ